MKKSYNVLWFDDEYQTLDIIDEKAMLADINLVGFSNAEEGLVELRNNLHKYDAVIVDGIFYQTSNQENSSVTQNAMAAVATELKTLEGQKKLPWFILSGQPSFTKDKNPFADFFKDNKVYDKLSDNDLEHLWKEIKLEADNQIDTQIRHEYKEVFDVCTDKYVGVECQKPLMQILKSMKTSVEVFDDELYFTQIRIVLEWMFRASNRLGLLHDACIPDGKVNLSESCKFLSGADSKHFNVNCSVGHFPKIIAGNIYTIINITGAASHTTEADTKNNINLSEYRKTINTPYLLYSLTFQLLDVLIWFKKYADQNSDAEQNKLLWREKEVSARPIVASNSESNITDSEPITGIIEQDEKGNYHCGEYILNYTYTQANFNLGDNIQIIEFQDNTSPKTKFYYPKFATKYCKIQ